MLTWILVFTVPTDRFEREENDSAALHGLANSFPSDVVQKSPHPIAESLKTVGFSLIGTTSGKPALVRKHFCQIVMVAATRRGKAAPRTHALHVEMTGRDTLEPAHAPFPDTQLACF